MVKLGLVGVGLGTAGLLLAGFAGSAGAQTGVWHQGYERAAESAECVAPADETPWQENFRGQREWTPSWAQWANDGQGGYVCQRHIIWAQAPAFPSAGCIKTQEVGGPFYSDFGGGYSLPKGSIGFQDADCTVDSGFKLLVPIVYAPAGFDPDALCRSAFGLGVNPAAADVPDVYACGSPGT